MEAPPPSAQPDLQPTLLPQGAGGRPVLYQVVAQHSYSAQGPEDLGFRQGDTVDVLCEGRVGMALPRQHCSAQGVGGLGLGL